MVGSVLPSYAQKVPGSVIEKKACEWAKERGWLPLKIGDGGKPDRLFIRDGVHRWVEFKGVREDLTPAQKIVFPKMQAAGVSIYICRDLAEFKARMV